MNKLIALGLLTSCTGSIDGPVNPNETYTWPEPIEPPCVFTAGSEHVLRLNAKYGTCHLPYFNLELKLGNDNFGEVKDCTGDVSVRACTVIMDLTCARGQLQGNARMDSNGVITGDAKLFSTSCRSLYTVEEGQ